MPFRSKAQRRKFAALLVEGKISPETYEEWNRETGGKVLPERVGRRKKVKNVTKKKAKRPARRAPARAASKRKRAVSKRRAR